MFTEGKIWKLPKKIDSNKQGKFKNHNYDFFYIENSALMSKRLQAIIEAMEIFDN